MLYQPFPKVVLLGLLTIFLSIVLSTNAFAQTTYHLHKEGTPTQLKTAGPDATTTALTSVNLKNFAPGEYIIKSFETVTGVPSLVGVVPSGSTVTFTLWLKKTASVGTMFPRAKLNLNSAAGPSLCSTTGLTALTTTLTKYTLTCNTTANVSMAAGDRYYLWVGVNLTATGGSNFQGSLSIEGTLNGNYDSLIVVPLPTSLPSVNITSPTNGSSFNAPTNITISASASDSDGTISKVEFFQGSTKLGEKTSSPYDFTWTNPAPASYGYSLTAKATDNAGATTTSSVVNIAVSGAGSLHENVVGLASSTPVNLTTEGSTDWVHWGLNTASSFDRKSGESQISNYTLIGTQAVQRLADSQSPATWNDGTPTASVTNNATGIFTSAANNGFQITVPADTTFKTLKLYVGYWQAQAKLEATLSDGSAPAIINTSFGGGGFGDGVFTINFKAASAGQTLTVKYTIATDYTPPTGNVRLQSATLAVASSGTGSLSGSLATPSTNINLTTEGSTDWTHWGMGSSTAFNHRSGVASQISNFTKLGAAPVLSFGDNPTRFSWTNGIPTLSASDTSTGVFVQGVGNGFQFSVPADTENKVLKVYLGVWRAQGKLEATLSDGSASSYTDSSLTNTTGTSNGVYTISFKAGSNGQSLRIKYTDITDYVGGANVTLEAATLSYVPPTITGLSSNSGAVGTEITINGTNFGLTQGGSTVTFNGAVATPTSWTSTSIVVPVPSTATTGPVVLTVRGAASNSQSFTVTPGITGLSPVSGVVGDSVTINGTTFGATQGSSGVTFNGIVTTPTSWSTSSITAPVPAGATSGPVAVTVGGVTSNGVNFAVGPKINSLLPSSGGVGNAVTISGTTFGASQGASTVTFNGIAASPTSWSAASITVPVPAGATTGPVVVTVGGIASNGSTFIVGPKINSLSPTSGALGDSVTISGTTFGATQGASTVTFNGTTATPTSWNATSIAVPVPTGATTGPVVVTVGGLASNEVIFTVGPRIDSLSPASGAVGDSITISGANFGSTQGTSTITFNGTSATPTNWTDSSITVPIPTDATTGAVVVTAGGSASNGINFTVVPKITSLSPSSGAAGEPITISGTTFGATQGTSSVTFNGTTATPASWSASSISVPVPAAATSGSVIVTVGGAASNSFAFTVTTTGAISGKVTVAGTTTPIPGVTVRALQGTTVVATASTNGTGDYVLSSVTVGTYTVEASATGYGTKRQNQVSVVAGTTTVNLSLDAIISGPVSYIYDPLGRLKATVGPIDTVVYEYDPVGNLLSIARQSSNQVAIIHFAPPSGPVGTNVTISGVGFSPTPSQNTVTFNGLAATVTSATATKLIATVPPGATTGPIAVTSPNGSATSSTSFIVGSSASGSPTITSFSPTIGSLNDVVTISGSNFEPTPADNKVRFNTALAQITSSSPTTIVTRASTTVSSKISVTTPYGTTVAAGDFFVPPPPRTAAEVEYAARMTIDSSLTPFINTTNKIAMVLFDGNAGQRISIKLGPSTCSYCYVDFYRPDGVPLMETVVLVSWAPSKFIEPFLLPGTGTYTIVVRGNGSTTGGIPISLYNMPPDISGTVEIGGPAQAVTNTTPGQNANLTFSGTQGQEISLLTSGSTITGSVTMKNPDGSELGFAYFNPPQWGSEAFIDKKVLPATGTYTVFVDPTQAATGTTNVRLYDATDTTGSIVAGGSPVTVTATTPGQNVRLTFEGNTGQRIALKLNSYGIDYTVYIKRPNGTNVAQINIASGWTGGFINTITLDTSGTYSILVDPYGTYTGNVTLTLYDVPPDLTGTLTIGNAPIPVSISNPGQNANLTFEGSANQQVTMRVTSSTYGCVLLTLLSPGGSSLVEAGPCSTNFNSATVTLPTSGTYTVRIDPSAANTGSLNLNVTSP